MSLVRSTGIHCNASVTPHSVRNCQRNARPNDAPSISVKRNVSDALQLRTVVWAGAGKGAGQGENVAKPSALTERLTQVVMRRQWLAGSAAIGIGLLDLLTPPAGKAAVEKPEDPFEGVYVKPALSLQAYLDQIDVDRATAFDEMRTDIETGKFTHLSNSLVIAPFDNVKQALFFIPWVVLRGGGDGDEEAGMRVQLAYLDFKDRLIALDQAAMDAARYQVEDQVVTDALEALDNSIDTFLAKIPS